MMELVSSQANHVVIYREASSAEDACARWKGCPRGFLQNMEAPRPELQMLCSSASPVRATEGQRCGPRPSWHDMRAERASVHKLHRDRRHGQRHGREPGGGRVRRPIHGISCRHDYTFFRNAESER